MEKARVHFVFFCCSLHQPAEHRGELLSDTLRAAVSPVPFDTKASSNGNLLLRVSRNLMRKLWDLIDGRR